MQNVITFFTSKVAWSTRVGTLHLVHRLRVVPHFSSGIVGRAKRERAWKSPHARKGDTRRGERKMRDYRQSPSFWPLWRPTDFGVWSSYHGLNQLSASNGIPSLIELSLPLSSVKCRGYLLQVKENPDTNFLRGFIFLSPRRLSPFLAWVDFHARSRFARPTIPEENCGDYS